MTKPLDLIRQAYAAFLFWKWDREHDAAVKRIIGCAHARTIALKSAVTVGRSDYRNSEARGLQRNWNGFQTQPTRAVRVRPHRRDT